MTLMLDVNTMAGLRAILENCTTLKDKVHALIDADQAKFQELIEGCQGWQDQLGAICSFILSFVNTCIFV